MVLNFKFVVGYSKYENKMVQLFLSNKRIIGNAIIDKIN
jgi:hypothetical protein